MRKLLNRMLRMVPLLALVLSFAHTSAQRPYGPLAETDFQITMTNIVQPAGTNNVIEFDLYILDTDPSQLLPMATAQFGINFNLGILDGAATTTGMTIALPYAEGFSDLPSSMAPNGASTLASGLIRIAGRAAPGCLDGFPISNVAPGTRANRFRFTSSVPFAPNSTPNFIFTSSSATNPSYATRFAWYNPGCTNVQLPVVPGVNALVLENPVLNPQVTCVDPTVFTVTGGGSYCEGGVGVPVGLDGSQVGVNYAIVPGTLVVPGDGNPITFGNQLAGTYTVVATSDGTNPGLCLTPVNMTGGADVTATPVSTVEFTESACDTYTWALNGQTYTVSGDYTYVVGCVTNILHLTITPSSTMEHTESACDSYLWALNGETYYVSGDYTYFAGCVTHILHLTITPSSTVEFTESACDTYTWALNGVTYNTSGDYTYVVGCVTNILHLTITPSSTVEYTATACGSYIWDVNGMTYTASGDYTYVVGCVTNILHLTITPSSTVEFTEAACDSYTWSVNGMTYTASGDYTFVDGCVTYILHLTITPSGNNEYTVSACDSYFWAVSGLTYTASGNYTFVNGCSTNVLHLTITPSSTVEFTAAACDTYTWALNGMTYTASGDYTYVDGCVTSILHLTITTSSIVESTVAACDSYTWAVDGVTYYTSGDYTYVVGCVTNILHLTITPSSTVEETVVADDSYTWAVNGVTYTASGDYTFVDECVTYILHLTINVVVPCPVLSTWNGSVSTDWFTAANWTPALVPCETTSVTIPAGCPNYPTITPQPLNSVACLVTITNLTITDGASLIGQQYLCVLNDAVVERSIVNSNFHLISSPVDAVTFGDVFLPAYWFEVWAREYDEPSGDWVNRFIADNLNVGQGYSVQMTTAPQTATFTGMLNGYDVTRTLSNMNTSSDVNRVGWNLLGNPFPSAIDWDAFSTGAYDAQVAVWDQAGAGNYIYWNGTVGSLTNGIIPAQNGFFVKTATNGAALTIPMAAQVHSPMALYKDAVANALELRANGNNYYDATFVHFNSNATADFDNQYDAFKLEGLETAPQLYNMAAGYNLSINELPFEGNEVVNLGFKCGVAGTYSLNASGMESFNSSTPILLEDLKLNILQDLRLNPVYSFNYATNDSEARFKLHFKAATGIADPANSGIFVYSYEHTVVINNTTNLNGEIRIFDMTGRELKDANMSATSETRLPLQVAVGTYIVKVTTAQGTVNQKVYVK
ncbi:MAG: T9SS type A sorting domain-containing protein [Bacteroidales bacterium]|nr:T9SS type A sorting domain-containing protein [Bacteroidales bacterium]